MRDGGQRERQRNYVSSDLVYCWTLAHASKWASVEYWLWKDMPLSGVIHINSSFKKKKKKILAKLQGQLSY